MIVLKVLAVLIIGLCVIAMVVGGIAKIWSMIMDLEEE